MTWIHYILIFWLVCIAISMWLRFRNKEDRETTLSQVLLIAVASPFVLLGIIVLKVGTFIENKVNEKKRKEKEQEELEVPEGLPLLLHYDTAMDADRNVIHYTRLLINPEHYTLTIIS